MPVAQVGQVETIPTMAAPFLEPTPPPAVEATPLPTVVVAPPTAIPTPPATFTRLNSGTGESLNDVAWNPDGSFALVVGEHGTLLKYDGASFTNIDTGTTFTLLSASWSPDGSKALITGGSANRKSLLMTYDGSELTTVSEGDGPNLYDSTWAPDGSYAIVVGNRGVVQRFDGNGLTDLGAPSKSYSGVSFNPDGSHALVINTAATRNTVLPFDGISFGEPIPVDTYSNLLDIDWKSDGSYGLMVGIGGGIYEYRDSGVTDLTVGIDDAMHAVDWRADGDEALVVGGRGLGDYYVPEEGLVMAYDGSEIKALDPGFTNDKVLFGMEWTPNGSYALMVGRAGTAIRYEPSTPAIVIPKKVMDQEFSPARYAFAQGFGNFDVGQSFVPEGHTLAAVGLPVCTGSQADEIEVQIRHGAYDGSVVASASMMLDAPFCGFGEERFTRFEFDQPAEITPGETYVIRMHSATPSDAGVFGAPGEYTDGHLFRFDHGAPVPDQDLGFKTYTTESAQ